MFWVIYLYDRELIFPKRLDAIIPFWLNHSLHTFNTLFAMVDMFIVHHDYPSRKEAHMGMFLFFASYSLW